MGKSSKNVTVGFRYFASLHWGVCIGRIEAFRSIWFGDKLAWSGEVLSPGGGDTVLEYLDQPGLFGGDDSEGGVFGWLEFAHGEKQQQLLGIKADGTYDAAAVTTALAAVSTGIPSGTEWLEVESFRRSVLRPGLPELAVNYRGLAVLNLHAFCTGNNAYLKEMSIEVERFDTGWYPEKCKIQTGLSAGPGGSTTEIIYGMNPAHIIREVYVSQEWGLGHPVDKVNDASFRAAADRLYDESFGLSLLLADDQSAEAFIDSIKETINASVYSDPKTDQISIKLLRPGDPIEMTLSPDNFRLTSFERRAMSETVNEISARYVSPETEKYQSTTVHDLANVEAQRAVNAVDRTYAGVRSEGMAQRLAQRDLQLLAATTANADGMANQSAWQLVPGSVVNLVWPELQIAGLRMRVLEVTEMASNNPEIMLTLGEDVFGQGDARFTNPQEPGWTPNAFPPKLFAHLQLWELPFWYVMSSAGVTVDAIPAEATYSTALASDPLAGAVRTNLHGLLTTPIGQQWLPVSTGPITPYVRTAAALGPAVQNTVQVNLSTGARLADATPGTLLLITDGILEEIAQVVSVSGNLVTLDRGLMDTHPRTWSSGSHLYFVGTRSFAVDTNQRSVGEFVTYRPAMQTGLGEMPVYDVPDLNGTLVGRFNKPYPPANIQIDGQYWPATISKAAGSVSLALTWATRNRIMQQTPIQVRWGEGSVTPEAGTTYSVEVRQGATLVGSATGVTGTSATVTLTGAVSGQVKISMWSERDGDESFIPFEHTLTLNIT